ncbi:MAG: terminase small subunit [Gammaproteobacteria bacterium]|nr:terminase small subunit [Gammaproteobacteria bacterium]
MTTLTPKQERFCHEYLVDLNATQAAIRAGYAENSAHVTGCRLLRNNKVSEAIAAGKAELAERAGVSQDWVIERLKEVREASMERTKAGNAHNPAAANRSLELIGKHGGMWQEGHVAGDINIQVNVHPWKDD